MSQLFNLSWLFMLDILLPTVPVNGELKRIAR